MTLRPNILFLALAGVLTAGVTGTQPEDGAGGVPVGVTPIVRFTDDFMLDAEDVRLEPAAGGESVRLRVETMGGGIRIVPESDLRPGMPYKLTVRDFSIGFTTGWVRWQSGAYTLTAMDQAVRETDAFLNNAASRFVEGVALRTTWGAYEGSGEDVLDWTLLDRNLEAIRAKEKQASVTVFPFGGWGSRARELPNWLEGAQYYYAADDNAGIDCRKQPIPWDPVFNEKWLGFIAKLGRHLYEERPDLLAAVAYVNGAGDGVTVNWAPTGPVFKDAACQERTSWDELGYSSEKMIGALQRNIDAFQKAFPGHVNWFSVGDIQHDRRGRAYVVEQAAAYGFEHYPDRFGLWREDLNANRGNKSAPRSPNIWLLMSRYRPKVGAQMVWSVQDCAPGGGCRMAGTGQPRMEKDAALRTAIEIGSSEHSPDGYYLTPYQEIYQADVQDSSLTAVFEHAARSVEWRADTTAPETPAGLAASDVGTDRARIAWRAAGDSWDKTSFYTDSLSPLPALERLGTVGYRVHRDGVLVATTPSTSYDDSGLPSGAGYGYRVTAFDAAGNESAPSEELRVVLK